MLGVILMRFAAVMFIKLLERFPRFETSAYLLVIVIGLKLCLDWYFNRRARRLPDRDGVARPARLPQRAQPGVLDVLGC